MSNTTVLAAAMVLSAATANATTVSFDGTDYSDVFAGTNSQFSAAVGEGDERNLYEFLCSTADDVCTDLGFDVDDYFADGMFILGDFVTSVVNGNLYRFFTAAFAPTIGASGEYSVEVTSASAFGNFADNSVNETFVFYDLVGTVSTTTVTPSEVPLPASLPLLAAALGGAAALRRRRG